MGEVIDLSERRDARRRRRGGRQPERTRAQFYFDLASPFTYLAAERVERAFDTVEWIPARIDLHGLGALPGDAVGAAAVRRAAEERAGALRMPLIWPESFPGAVPAAMRVAAAAAHSGRGAAFVLAASRLAFCGGYDLEDPETLAEAAAAAGIQLEDCLSAAGAAEHDRAIQAAGRELLADGVQELPALRIGPGLYAGDTGVDDALTAARVARVIQA